ncbi:hypothetical protein IFM89_031678 [Coptis chinensis]|uniref:Uncharacterized protein n=1 Tax=Coptis chinensis TaxID=261450 RepID=A0A835HT99_9MAGN|nr:hypothetical protein IFM89_031678 [Coptis chinensis]
MVEAYFAQFVKDMESFLSARAQELLSGGLMALILPTYTKEMLSIKSFHRPLEILGSCLMEMSKKGIVSEAKVDPFNMPVYSPSSEELEEVMKNNGYFSIERAKDAVRKEQLIQQWVVIDASVNFVLTTVVQGITPADHGLEVCLAAKGLCIMLLILEF